MGDSAAFALLRASTDHVAATAQASQQTPPQASPARPRRGRLRPSRVPVPGGPAGQARITSPAGALAQPGLAALRPGGASPGSPLPDGVRGRMERAFGSGFADVRVHAGSAVAARIGAQALTAGNDIHVAPGASAAEALIGHELAHVVQQRQGRVAPTALAGGMPLNLDRRLEREADEQGARAGRGEHAGGLAAGPVAGVARPAAAQGKFGFEFQTSNSFVAADDIAIVGEKVLAFEDTAKKFKVEGDEGRTPDDFDVEFITEPLTTVREAKVAIEGAAALARNLGRGGPLARRAQGDGFDGGTWTRAAAIRVKDRDFHAKPQASVGVVLADIPELLSRSLSQEEGRTLSAVGQQTEAIKQSEDWGTWRTSSALSGFLHLVVYYIHAAGQRNWVDPNDRESFPSLKDQVIISDGPKAMFSVMARTDFHSMFNALDPADQKAFITGLIGSADNIRPNRDLEKIIGAPLTAPMITAPYRADKVTEEDRVRFRIEPHKDKEGREHEIVMEGPTILDWLLSIVTGHSHKDAKPYAVKRRDMLSAPVGWGSRDPARTGFPKTDEIVADRIYGMGAYPMDETAGGKLAVFELRTLSTNLRKLGDPPYWNWWLAADSAIKEELQPGKPRW